MNEQTSTPNPLIGFIFPLAFLVYEFSPFNSPDDLILRLIIVVAAMAYYVWNVYLIHKFILERFNKYPYSARWASLANIIPVYNAYWMYKWVDNLWLYYDTKFAKSIFNRSMVHGLMIGGIALTRFDFAIGFAFFWSGVTFIIQGVNKFEIPINLQTDSIVNGNKTVTSENAKRLKIPDELR